MKRRATIWAVLITCMLIVPMTAWAFGTISGTVTEQATGNPLSGVTVRLANSGGTVLTSTTTDASGLYTLASVTAGSNYQVQARSGVSYMHKDITGVSVTDGNTTTVNIAMSPGGQITGTVYSAVTGTPIAGIQVVVFDSTWYQYRMMTTNGSGVYTAGGLPVRSDYRVAAVGNSTYGGQWQSPITVTPGVPVAVNYTLTGSGSVSGTVTDSVSGAPVAGIMVNAYIDGWPCSPGIATDMNGQYTIVGLTAYSGYTVQADPSTGHSGAGQAGVSVTVGNTTTVDLALDPVATTGAISGIITASDTGLPVENLQVNIFDGNMQWYGWAQTDASGNYMIPDLPVRSDYQVQVQGNATYATQMQTGVSVTAGSMTTVDFSLAQAGSISGTVTASGTGLPIADLPVSVCFNNGCIGGAPTDASGNYTVYGVPERSDLQVQVQGDATYAGQTKTGISVTAGNTTAVNFSLALGGRISGTVTAGDTGLPIGGLQVSISDGTWQWYGGVQTDGSGNYTVYGLPARTDYVVQVMGNATYAGQTRMGITVTAGNLTAENFSLDLGGNISGTVRDAVTGVGISGITVMAIDANNGPWTMLSNANTNPDGTYVLFGIPPGSHKVVAMSNMGGWYIQQFYGGTIEENLATSVTVTSGNTTPGIDINLTKGGTISGHVTTSTGSPLANAEVAAVLPSNKQIVWSTTDASGAFTLGPVPSGVAVEAMAPGTNYVGQYYGGTLFLSSATTVTVTPETDTSGIDISLPSGGVLTGTITVDGIAAQDGWVNLYSVTDGRWLFNSAAEGYVMDPGTGTWSVAVPAGTYKVWAGAMSGMSDVPSMYYDSTLLFDDATEVVSAGTGAVSNINFALSSARGTVTGTVSYGGALEGEVIEWTSPNAGNDWPKMSSGNGSGLGAYSLIAAPGTWYVKAFMDKNRNGKCDAGEPFGEYAGGSIVVTNGNTVSGVDIALADSAAPHASAKIGVYQNGTWYLDANQSWDWNGTPTDVFGIFGAGLTNAIPVTGDWNGDGTTEIGIYADGIWYLDMNGNWQWDGEGVDVRGVFGVGLPNAIPVVGDWNGDGTSKIGIYSEGNWYLDKNQNWAWDGTPTDTYGLFGVGLPNVVPVTGDWNGDGTTEIGVYSEGNWYLDRNQNWQWDGTPTDTYGLFGVGLPNVIPVTGDWNGDGITKIGVYSEGNWYLDTNASWQWDGTPTDTYGIFGVGLGTVVPVTGNW